MLTQERRLWSKLAKVDVASVMSAATESIHAVDLQICLHLCAIRSAPISEAAQLEFKLDDLVRRIWEIESLEEPMVTASKEKLECEQHFVNNFSRLPSGEYMVRMPLKHSAKLLGDSYDQAYRRFLSIEPLTADICKMYRCVRVARPDSLYQCILWRDSPEEDIKVFKLDTVTYGTKSAPFQSVRAMHQLAIDERDAYPIGSRALQQEFYVDDFISGANSVEEARQKMDQTCAILARGQFKLRKWCSSHEKFLDGVAAENREQFLKFDDGSDVTKALGLSEAVETLMNLLYY
ncbi:hypothetical protein ACLKA6_013879 [Drosophila palustris]